MKKVQSWKTLLATVAGGGGAIFYKLYFDDFDGLEDLIWWFFMIYLIIQGLLVSFSREAYEEDREKSERAKQIYKNLFGKWAPLAPYGSIILLLPIWPVAKFLPEWTWLIILFILSALAYGIWLNRAVKKADSLYSATSAREP